MLIVVKTHATQLPTFQGLKFNNQTVLWIDDTVSYSVLDSVLAQTGKPKYIVNNNTFGHYGRDIYCLPLFLENQIKKFQNFDYNDNVVSNDCFNFSINKKNENRNLLLKLLEFFKLSTKSYTWSGVSQNFDMSRVIQELHQLQQTQIPFGMTSEQYQLFRSNLLTSCKIPASFITHPGQMRNNISILNYGGNTWTWQNGLDQIYKQTSVSLIGESVEYQKTSCVTEKTGYAVLGLTFPIWIGSYGTADAWEAAGFDCFHDVIDHSYQFKETLIERCYYAFHDNIKILQDLDYAQAQRTLCKDRLLENRKKLLSGALTKYCHETISTWPADLGKIANIIMNQTAFDVFFTRQFVV